MENGILQSYATTVIPIILTVYAASKIDKLLNKVLPAVVKPFFVHFFTLLITIPLALIVIGQITVALQNLIGLVVTGLIGLNAGIAGLILGNFWSVLVMFGLRWGVIPMFALNVSNYEYDVIPLFSQALGLQWEQFLVLLSDPKVLRSGILLFPH